MIRLKEMRKARGLTQAQLAEKVRHADPTADQTMISVLERGELYPGEKLRDALCQALCCTEADLYDGVEAFFVPAKDREVSETTERLGEILGFGRAKAVSRQELRDLTGWPDRVMRRNIQAAREEGMVICNEQNGGGYYRPDTDEELVAQYRANQHRALAILRQQKHIRGKIHDRDTLY